MASSVWPWLLGAAGLCWVATAAAQEQRSYDWLRGYRVEAECPSEQEFRQRLSARVGRSLVDAFARLRLEVTILRGQGSGMLTGRLRVRDDTGAISTREVEGQACSSVLEALSLVAALSADAAPPLQTVAPAAEPEDTPPVLARVGKDGLELGPVAFAVLDTAAAPGVALGVGGGVSLSWLGNGFWSPRLQLSALLMQSRQPLASSAAQSEGVESEFFVSALNATLCPLQLLAGSHGSLRPCVEFEAGRITGAATGAALALQNERHGVWLNSGLNLRASLALWGPFELASSFGASLPWVRHEFFLAPDTMIFQVPALGWRATGSLAAAF